MKLKRSSLVLAALASTIVGGVAYAQIVVNTPREFSAPNYVPPLDGWTSDQQGGFPTYVDLSLEGTGGSPIGGGGPQGGNAYLGITFNYGFPPTPLDPLIANSTAPYVGPNGSPPPYSLHSIAIDPSQDGRLVFDFLAQDFSPTVGSAIRIVGGNGAVWANVFSSTQLGVWEEFSMNLDIAGTGWTLQSGSGTFLDALQSPASVQLDIEGYTGTGGGGTQRFGLDNWMYAVPEPGTMYMLGAALLGLATTFRRQIQGGIELLKKG